MKTRRLIATALLGLVLATGAERVMAKDISLVADDWPPYNSTPDSDKPGYAIELAQAIFSAKGYQISYKQVQPWKAAVHNTRQGRYIAIVGASRKEAPDFVFPEEEIGWSSNAFFVKKNGAWRHWRYVDSQSLKNMRVGLIGGYSYGPTLDQFFKKHPSSAHYLHGKNALTRNVHKLLMNRVDVVIADANVMYYQAKEMNRSQHLQQALSTPDTDDNRVYIAFSPQHPKAHYYAKVFTHGIRKLRQNGKLDTLLARYNIRDWKAKPTRASHKKGPLATQPTAPDSENNALR